MDDDEAHEPGRPPELLGYAVSGYGPGMDAQSQAEPIDRAPRVLVVDDNAAMRRVLRGLLEDVGMHVVGEASDGLEGVAQVEALRPDVVLMDWRMPGLDGLEATAQIRSRLPEVQVVMFSAAESDGMATIAGHAGARAFVAKGASAQQVCAAVVAAWRGRHRPPYPLTGASSFLGEGLEPCPTLLRRSRLQRWTACDLRSPLASMTARAHWRPAVSDRVRTQHGPRSRASTSLGRCRVSRVRAQSGRRN
jgi:CheY-like chemotaxis protein